MTPETILIALYWIAGLLLLVRLWLGRAISVAPGPELGASMTRGPGGSLRHTCHPRWTTGSLGRRNGESIWWTHCQPHRCRGI